MKSVKFKKLTKTAKKPKRANLTDAGLDLFTDEVTILLPHETKAIATNIAIELPVGFMADVRPRSGLTLNTRLRVHLGTIDSGFRDGIGIICENTSEERIVIHHGFKLAQLVIQKIPGIILVETNELEDSDRGLKGFGSSGV